MSMKYTKIVKIVKNEIFIVFASKHRTLWVLGDVPTIYVLSKYIKTINVFLVKFSIFTAEKNSLYNAWASCHNVTALVEFHVTKKWFKCNVVMSFIRFVTK